MLLDSNILLRTLQPHHEQYSLADQAVQLLPKQGEELHIVPQNLIELWAVATRPVAQNGLGMNIEQAAAELTRLKTLFNFLADTSAIYPVWESLVIQYQVSGKPTHDARLVAAMHVHGLKSILTFNTSDFTRYADIKIVHPAQVLALE